MTSIECDRTMIEGWSVRELKQWLLDHSLSPAGLTEKSELVDLVIANYGNASTQVTPPVSAPQEEIFATPADLASGKIDLEALFKSFAEAKRNAPPPPPSTPGCDIDIETVKQDDKNSVQIVCRQCGCALLKPGKGLHAVHPVAVPAQTPGADDLILQHQWRVGDMYDFDNLGFCRQESESSTTKFLTCADCEREIIGIHYLKHHTEFPGLCFLSHDRVAYLN